MKRYSPLPRDVDTTPINTKVVLREGGHRYHKTDECRVLGHSPKPMRLINQGEAFALGARPCRVCMGG